MKIGDLILKVEILQLEQNEIDRGDVPINLKLIGTIIIIKCIIY